MTMEQSGKSDYLQVQIFYLEEIYVALLLRLAYTYMIVIHFILKMDHTILYNYFEHIQDK